MPKPVSAVNSHTKHDHQSTHTLQHWPVAASRVERIILKAKMQLRFTTIDVFTTTPYIGNPLAIVRIPRNLRAILTEAQKQNIARKSYLSEATFLHEPLSGNDHNTVDFDIFTPLSRLAFARHPTIGTTLYTAMNPGVFPGVRQSKT